MDLFEKYKTIERCIFISHKKEDINEAIEIGNYIMQQGIDIYLDTFDKTLQIAANDDNHEAITACLENGLLKSTHLLSIISESTRDSWWVPYEIGYGKRSNVNIASILLEDFDDNNIPSYLKISKIIYGQNTFDDYLAAVFYDSLSLLEKHYKEIKPFKRNKFEKHPLNNILKTGK